jgi:hypothetical protein
MSTGMIIYFFTGAIIAVLHIYIQLLLADNFPSRHWGRTDWEILTVIALVCIFCWPLVVVCMFLDGSYTRTRTELQQRKWRVLR